MKAGDADLIFMNVLSLVSTILQKKFNGVPSPREWEKMPPQ